MIDTIWYHVQEEKDILTYTQINYTFKKLFLMTPYQGAPS
jgi:hypothetical protein